MLDTVIPIQNFDDGVLLSVGMLIDLNSIRDSSFSDRDAAWCCG